MSALAISYFNSPLPFYKKKEEELTTERGSRVELNSEIKHLVDGYLNNNPKLTVNAFAGRSGIPATTLRRILSGKTKAEISPHTILAIVSYIHREKRIAKVIEKTSGAVYDVLSKNFSRYIFDNTDYVSDETLNDVLKDRTCYFIYKLAANKKGISRNFIRMDYGENGIRSLDKMIKIGLISESEGICHAKEKNFSLDVSVALKHNQELMNFFKLEEAKEGQNLYYTMSQGMNEEGIKKIKDVKRTAVKAIQEIMNNEAYQGVIPYFSMMMSDTMIYSKKSELQEQVKQ